MSKTFAGTVSFDFKLVLSDESVSDVLSYVQQHVAAGVAEENFAQYIRACATDDERIVALWKKAMRTGVKEFLQEVHSDTANGTPGDSFTFSPISVQVKGKA